MFPGGDPSASFTSMGEGYAQQRRTFQQNAQYRPESGSLFPFGPPVSWDEAETRQTDPKELKKMMGTVTGIDFEEAARQGEEEALRLAEQRDVEYVETFHFTEQEPNDAEVEGSAGGDGEEEAGGEAGGEGGAATPPPQLFAAASSLTASKAGQTPSPASFSFAPSASASPAPAFSFAPSANAASPSPAFSFAPSSTTTPPKPFSFAPASTPATSAASDGAAPFSFVAKQSPPPSSQAAPSLSAPAFPKVDMTFKPLTQDECYGRSDLFRMAPKADMSAPEVGDALLAAIAAGDEARVRELAKDADEDAFLARDWSLRTPLTLAVERQRWAIVAFLAPLVPRSCLSLIDCDGRSPACWAAFHGHVPSLELVLDLSPQSQVWEERAHSSPLHEAVIGKREEALRYLLSKVPLSALEYRDRASLTPFGRAVSQGDLQLVEMLLTPPSPDDDRVKADPEGWERLAEMQIFARDFTTKTPVLCRVLRTGTADLCHLLLSHAPKDRLLKPLIGEFLVFHAACSSPKMSVVQRIAESQPGVVGAICQGKSGLSLAVSSLSNGSKEARGGGGEDQREEATKVIEWLLQQPEINSVLLPPAEYALAIFQNACLFGYLPAVTVLLAKYIGLGVSSGIQEGLAAAAELEDESILRYILAEVPREWLTDTVLTGAARGLAKRGGVDALRLVISLGSVPMLHTACGFQSTPLAEALSNSQEDAVDCIVSALEEGDAAEVNHDELLEHVYPLLPSLDITERIFSLIPTSFWSENPKDANRQYYSTQAERVYRAVGKHPDVGYLAVYLEHVPIEIVCGFSNALLVAEVPEAVDLLLDAIPRKQWPTVGFLPGWFYPFGIGELEVFSVYLERLTKEELFSKDERGRTLLHSEHVTKHCGPTLAAVVDKYGPDVLLIVDEEGRTPLHSALSPSLRPEVAMLILDHLPKGGRAAVDGFGHTPAYYIRNRGKEKVFRDILNRLAVTPKGALS